MSVDLSGLSASMDPSIVWLDEPCAADARLSGAKASNLAIARQHGLPVIEGFAITSTAVAAADRWNGTGPGGERLHDAWATLSANGTLPLAVRSSSVLEDGTGSSVAGRFRTVLHVSGWDPFLAAVHDVIASAVGIGDAGGIGDGDGDGDAVGGPAPMAVLVQPMADARVGGVLFGIDPLTGDRAHSLVSATDGLPDRIVSGEVVGEQVLLRRRGGVSRHGAGSGHGAGSRRGAGPGSGAGAPLLGSRERRRLARLARDAERLFGAPQDIEWLILGTGELRLLQSRPITASAMPVAGGHVLGAGPVAETFPAPLARLERDLWEGPLETGVREALRLSGAVSARALAEHFVVDIRGRVAVDLEALGVVMPRRTWWRLLDPRPPLRRLFAAWRVGRLRVAMPAIAHDLVSEVDGDLRSLAALDRLGDVQLLTVLSNAQRVLATLHAHEVLAGFFVDRTRPAVTGASEALTTLRRARLDGLDDHEIVAEHPVVLALTAPRIGGPLVLPPTPRTEPTPRTAPAPLVTAEVVDPNAVARESLRLRARWVQELTARVAMELGTRLEARAQLAARLDVRHIDLAVLRDAVEQPGAAVEVPPDDLGGPPLPDRFRLAVDGSVVPDVEEPSNRSGGGPVGVSTGRVVGIVTHDPLDATGKVLVVRTLDPRLAAAVEVAAGLVAEQGGPLSHLAILAREFGVPAVTAMAGAASTLRAGERVLVDGGAGTVERLDLSEPEPVTPGRPVRRDGAPREGVPQGRTSRRGAPEGGALRGGAP